MKRWSWHRTRVLLLAVLLGLGMSLSFVQGSAMAATNGRRGWRRSSWIERLRRVWWDDHKDMDAGTCLAVCGSAAQGLMSGELLMLPSASRTGFEIAQLLLSGQSHPPDHGPPKTLTLG